jgi:cytochrome P450
MNITAFQDMAIVDSFAEASEVLNSKDFEQGAHNGGAGGSDQPLLGDTLLTLHGDAHFARRRMENALFRRPLLAVYEETLVRPAIRGRMQRQKNGGPGPVRTDLLPLTRAALQVVAAKVIGLDSVRDDASVDRLAWYADVFHEGANVDWTDDPESDALNRGLQAKAQFVAEFVEPARSRRLDLLQHVKEGKLSESELPSDLLMMLIARKDEEGWDDEHIIRETVLYVIGSSGTLVQTSAHTTWQLLDWLEQNPTQRAHLDDVRFLREATHETLRLYPTTPALIRRAAVDVALSGGRRVAAGDSLYLDLAAANRDKSVFGADADMFIPGRVPPERSRPYGLSFGGGAHMCIGRALATGGAYLQAEEPEAAVAGVVPCLLHEFFDAGVEVDTVNPPRMVPNTPRHKFATFPVVFTKL